MLCPEPFSLLLMTFRYLAQFLNVLSKNWRKLVSRTLLLRVASCLFYAPVESRAVSCFLLCPFRRKRESQVPLDTYYYLSCLIPQVTVCGVLVVPALLLSVHLLIQRCRHSVVSQCSLSLWISQSKQTPNTLRGLYIVFLSDLCM